MSDADGFTCSECLSAEATLVVPDNEDGGEHYICRECWRKFIENYMLDLVASGEMAVAADGKSFELTEKWHARRRYEAGEGGPS